MLNTSNEKVTRLTHDEAVMVLLLLKKYKPNNLVFKEIKNNVNAYVNLLDAIRLFPDSLYSAGELLRNNQLTVAGIDSHKVAILSYLKTYKLDENLNGIRIFKLT